MQSLPALAATWFPIFWGSPILTGPAVRIRIYSAYKRDLALIARVITSFWVFFWTENLLLLRMMLLVHP